MAGTITHEWNGTTLTITSDSGTSSMDLKGATGAIGPRGPQGPAGTVTSNTNNVDLTGYATEAYVDQKIADVEAGIIDLSNYYTRDEVDEMFDGAQFDDYYTKSQSDARYLQEEDIQGLATETFVTNKIAEAQLSAGDGETIDLTGYATKDDLNNYRRLDNDRFEGIKLTDGTNTLLRMNAWGIGSDTNNILWISSDGTGAFATSLTLDGKPVATEEFVSTKITEALAALVNGDEVSY